MKSIKTIKTFAVASISALVLEIVSVALIAQPVQGATLTTSYIRLNRMAQAATTSFRVVFKAASNQTANVVIDMNGADAGAARWGFATPAGVVNGTQTVATAQCVTDTGFTALPGSITAAGSGSVVTISSVGATTSGTTYCVDLTSATAVTNPLAGEYHPTITIGTDSTTVGVRTLAVGGDSITVTAVVPPTFAFVLSGTSDAFTTNLATGSVVSTTGKTITITTNAASGWITWVKGLNASSGAATKGALKSAAAGNYTIPTTNANALGSASHTLTPGTEDYGLGTTITTDAAGGGTVTLASAYDGTSTKAGVLDVTNYQPVATANGTANGDVITLTERATIAGQTPAGNDYTDTISVIGAGNF